MAEVAQLEFTLGETWVVEAALNDAAAADLDLTGATVRFRASRNGVLMLDLRTDADSAITVHSPSSGGVVTISVDPNAQRTLYAAVYDYEIRVTLADGTVTTQLTGDLTLNGTLF